MSARIDDAVAAVLAARERPAPPGALANLATFAWRALLKIKHGPEQLFDVAVTPVMFTVMFTYLFGGAVAGSSAVYLQYLLPGIMVQTVMFTSIYTGFTLNTDIGRGIFDRFRSMPIWAAAPVAGAIAGDMVRHAASAVLVIAVGLILGFRPEGGVLGVAFAIGLLLVFAAGIGWIFTAVGLIVRTPATVMTMSWLVLMPVTFLSNIYVDPATMPDWLAAIVGVNPVALLTTAIRGVIHGRAVAGDIAFALIGPAVVAGIFAPIAMLLYRRER
ncbi:MAG: ABC transporter permease [Alphaproteobacteria bacterium]